MAIIAILAAILFPVFVKAREKAQQTACLSNLKQIGLAFGLYAQDYQGGVCPYGTGSPDTGAYTQWELHLYPYVTSLGVYGCPSSSFQPTAALVQSNYSSYLGAYGWNLNLFNDPATFLVTLADLDMPAIPWSLLIASLTIASRCRMEYCEAWRSPRTGTAICAM